MSRFLVLITYVLVCTLWTDLCNVSANTFNYIKRYSYNTAFTNSSHRIKDGRARSLTDCGVQCSSKEKCRSFNYAKKAGVCQLNSYSFTQLNNNEAPGAVDGFNYYEDKTIPGKADMFYSNGIVIYLVLTQI